MIVNFTCTVELYTHSILSLPVEYLISDPTSQVRTFWLVLTPSKPCLRGQNWSSRPGQELGFGWVGVKGWVTPNADER